MTIQQDVSSTMLSDLRALRHLAEVLINRHRADLPITPVMWDHLEQRCKEAHKTINQASEQEDEAQYRSFRELCDPSAR